MPATIGDLMTRQTVITNLRATSKPQLLAELAGRAMPATKIDRLQIFRALLDREAVVSTGLGMGAAIPNARFKGLRTPFALFIRLAWPIDYNALDGRPVDLLLLLLGPDPANDAYLNILVSASRALRDPTVRDRLRSGADPRTVFADLGESAATQSS